MRQSGADGRWLSTGGPQRRVSTDRTRIVLLTVIGLLLAVLSPLVVSGSPTSAATVVWGTPTQIPVPVSDEGGYFTSVSCSDPLDCTAVGYTAVSTNAGNGPQPIAVTETNGVWGNVVLFAVGLKDQEEWSSVSCASALNCVAVGESGEFGGAGARLPVYADETNGAWGPVTTFPGTVGDGSAMDGISCPALGYCVAVGSIGYVEFPNPVPGPTGPSAAIEIDGVWGPDNVLPTSTIIPDTVSSVSCVAVNVCYAVGMDSSDQPYSVADTGTWGAPKIIGGSSVNAISCADVCTAVGNGTYSIESGGVWNTYSLPGINATAVSCVDPIDCTAVGAVGYVTETGGVWGAPTAIVGFPSGTESIASISCADATDCTMVGNDGDIGSLPQPFYVTSQPEKTDQAPLTVTSTSGVYGTALALTTSGGSGTGAVSYAVTNGTASGCALFYAALLSTSAGTCIVVATKAGDATYNATSSPAATVTFSAPPPPSTPPPIVTSPTITPNHGYWLVGSDGGIFSFGSAQFYGSTGSLKLQRPVVGITPTANDAGYWLVASDGGVFTFGNAAYYGSIPGLGYAPAGSASAKRLDAPIVGMVPTADGGGYFMVGSDGGVFSFGDAKFEGSCPGMGGCSGAAVAVMPDSTGHGYWLVTATGHVYTFGDAPYYGAPGPQRSPVTSAVRTTDGQGYWILLANGTVYAYGDAADLGGPVGSVDGTDPATTIFTTADGGGYWVASASGSVFTYGDAPYDGGMSGVHLNGSIIAATGW